MIIFHHYDLSPFSEKVRLMFGYAGLPWQSLLSPEMPPRPNLDPLTGGYRRIPVLQIGADLFCDTRLISEEVAVLANKPELAPGQTETELQSYLANLEGPVFWACVLSIPLSVTLKQLVKSLGVWQTLRFLKDRAGMGKNARMDTPSPKEAAQQFQQHLEELEQRLQGDFLFGPAPTVADFAAYHTLWFKRVVGKLPLPAGLPRVDSWFQRCSALGHGDRQEITQEQAFAAARENSPRTIADELLQDSRVGSRVSIGPSDYGRDAVSGTLVGCSATRYVLARDTGDFGMLHVHFPSAGFELTTEVVG